MRGDSLYCPLSLSLDSYGNCLEDCWHCWVRNLNYVWGEGLKPADIDLLEKKLINGLKNTNPKTTLAWALSQKKTIRWGNKSDPFQSVEKHHKLAPKIFNILSKLDWTFVIQTRFTGILSDYEKYIDRANSKQLITIMPVISPGLEKDWEILERKRTTPIQERGKNIQHWIEKGIPLGVNGEPFIPGFHEIKDFENTVKWLKSIGVQSYNTYNLHFNAFSAKRLHAIGMDIEKIWFYNQDKEWKKILAQLLKIAKKYNMPLGCPDFVNTGMNYQEPANTCCGVNVKNPCTFNSHFFKKYKQKGFTESLILKTTYDGTGDYEMGKSIIEGTCKQMYNLHDLL